MKFFVPLFALIAAAAALPASDGGDARPVRKIKERDDSPKPVLAEDLKFYVGDRTVCGTEDNLENIVCYKGEFSSALHK